MLTNFAADSDDRLLRLLTRRPGQATLRRPQPKIAA